MQDISGNVKKQNNDRNRAFTKVSVAAHLASKECTLHEVDVQQDRQQAMHIC